MLKNKIKITGLLLISSLLLGLIPAASSYAATYTGKLGTWQMTTDFPQSSGFISNPVVANGYVHVLAYEDNSSQNTEYYAPLNSSGTVGSWQTTTALPSTPGGPIDPASGASLDDSAITLTENGYIYEIDAPGSQDSSTDINYYAPLNSNGTIGSWQTTTVAPTPALDSGTYTATSVYVYALGGNDSGTPSLDYYAPLNSNGTIGSWQSTTNLPASAENSNTFISDNGYVYALGGGGLASGYSDTYYAPLNSNGTIGSWQSTTAVPKTNSIGNFISNNGYLYDLKGSNNYYAPLNSNGTIGSWQSTTALPGGSASNEGYLMANNNFLYATPISTAGSGGGSGSSTVYFAPMLMGSSNLSTQATVKPKTTSNNRESKITAIVGVTIILIILMVVIVIIYTKRKKHNIVQQQSPIEINNTPTNSTVSSQQPVADDPSKDGTNNNGGQHLSN